jgi:hypothetical protein
MDIQIKIERHTRNRTIVAIDDVYVTDALPLFSMWERQAVVMYCLFYEHGRWYAVLYKNDRKLPIPQETTNWRSITALQKFVIGEIKKYTDFPF